MSVRGNYYFNENKRFPIEYFIIPIIFAGLIYGGYRLYTAYQVSKSPAAAAERILNGLTNKDYDMLQKNIRFTESERKTFEINGKPKDTIEGLYNQWEIQYNMKITGYEIGEATKTNNTATVKVKIIRNDGRSYDSKLILEWDSNNWWVTTDGILNLVFAR